MDRRGEHVVGGLAHVDVVVGVHPVAREARDHLVGVRVRGGPRAGLEDVDRELRVVRAAGDLFGGPLDARGGALGEQPEFGVDGGGGALDARPASAPPRPGPSHRRSGSSRRPCRSRRPTACCSLGIWLSLIGGRSADPIRRTPSAPGRGRRGRRRPSGSRCSASTRSWPSGSSAQRLFGGGERVQAVLVGPQQQHGHLAGAGRAPAAASAAPRGHCAGALGPRAGQARVAGDVGEGVADEVGGGGVRAGRQAHAALGPEDRARRRRRAGRRGPERRPRWRPAARRAPRSGGVGGRVQAVGHQHQPRGAQRARRRSRAAGSPRRRRGRRPAAGGRAPRRRRPPITSANQSSV